MSDLDLSALKRGTVIRAGSTLLRKSNRDSWYPINAAGHRQGTHNAVRTANIRASFGAPTVDAETERLTISTAHL